VHITVSREVPADPDRVWAHLTEVANLAELSPENLSSTWLDEPGPGARFKGRNANGFLRWSTVATVTEWEPGQRFGFEISPPSRTRWRYELEPVAGGTRVTESMTKDEAQPLPIRVLQRLGGVTDREAHLRSGMEQTLARLAAALR
jgi:uncharacterized protein YndB with AHSA1/START domain